MKIPQLPAACDVAAGGRRGLPLADDNSERDYCAEAAVAALTGNLDPSVLAAMDKDALKKQIENMKYQATMERWPLSKSIAAACHVTTFRFLFLINVRIHSKSHSELVFTTETVNMSLSRS
uniref:Guanine nucleotide-binding protein subunit gamma n=1 Tax=Timema monikensis TaxID=170555 RepID=A0A7R9E457_9NEOP|nr:unnamed protein product [Timema monikensis]